MNARLGLAPGLTAMGVRRDQFSHIIEGAMADHCHKTNPRLASVQDYELMLEDDSPGSDLNFHVEAGNAISSAPPVC